VHGSLICRYSLYKKFESYFECRFARALSSAVPLGRSRKSGSRSVFTPLSTSPSHAVVSTDKPFAHLKGSQSDNFNFEIFAINCRDEITFSAKASDEEQELEN
jgi:hypothetical protein